MTDYFVVHLGAGTYLDASGKIISGPPTGAQIYKPTEGVKFEIEKVQKALEDFSKILPDESSGSKLIKKWHVPVDLVKLLIKVGVIVSTVAVVVKVAALVLSFFIDALTSDSDGINPLAYQMFKDISIQLQAMQEHDRAREIAEMTSRLIGASREVQGKLTSDLFVAKPTGAARAQVFSDIQDIIEDIRGDSLPKILNYPWDIGYDRNAYSDRAWASNLLVFERPDGSLARVPPNSPTITMFDYRPGVPMLLYLATSFVTLIQVGMPWFRSSGRYSQQLRDIANTIDGFVLRMQEESISRTEYTREMILQEYGTNIERPSRERERISLGFMQGSVPAYWAVGAFDRVRYTDTFLVDQYLDAAITGTNTGQRGLFNYRWPTPTATLGDPVATAAASNEQSRQDYANLQVSTGMIQLITTAAWLRFLSTPPNQSQTVSGRVRDNIRFLDEAPTTAKSPFIYPDGVIEHDATLKRYNTRSIIQITTQEPGYKPSLHYRVVLRTIESNEGWYNLDYSDIWKTYYEPSQSDPRCKRLRTVLRKEMVLDEYELYKGPSPDHKFTLSDRKTMRASTFDWYVPVLSKTFENDYSMVLSSRGSQRDRISTGGRVSIHLMGNEAFMEDEILAPPTPLSHEGPAPLVDMNIDDNAISELFIQETNIPLEKAERRHVKTEDVDIEWKLEWNAGKMVIELYGQPKNRSFRSYIVVEETVYSGEPTNLEDIFSHTDYVEEIHTPFVAEIANQLVFVPEKFFKKEHEALVKNAKMWQRFVYRLVDRGPIGPGDPIKFLQEPISELSGSLSTYTLAKTFDMQVNFAMLKAPELWNEVLQETKDTSQ